MYSSRMNTLVCGFLLIAGLVGLSTLYRPPALAEGIFDDAAPSYNELKKERDRFGPRGDRNPQLAPGDHPDDAPPAPKPLRADDTLHRITFYVPSLITPRIWHCQGRPQVSSNGILRFYVQGREVQLHGDWTVEALSSRPAEPADDL